MILFLTNSLEQLIGKPQLYSLPQILIGLGLSLLIGLFIFIVYKFSFQGTAYSYTFNLSLVLMTIITTVIILTVSSNLVLSLGMVGALSIVRFRAALKDPIDIVYIFWSISAGLSIGATQYLLAVVGSLFIGIVITFLTAFKLSIRSCIVVVNYNYEDDLHVFDILNANKYKFKSKNVDKNNNTELTVEVFKDINELISSLKRVKGVTNVSVLAFEE